MLAALEPMAEYGYRWNVDEESKFNLEHLILILDGRVINILKVSNSKYTVNILPQFV